MTIETNAQKGFALANVMAIQDHSIALIVIRQLSKERKQLSFSMNFKLPQGAFLFSLIVVFCGHCCTEPGLSNLEQMLFFKVK